MAIKEWLGLTTDINSVGNWLGGVIPGSSDIAVYNDGSVDCLGTATNPQWLGIEIYPGYTGTLGAVGSPMIVSSEAIRHLGGTANMHWKDAGAASATEIIAIAAANRDVIIELDGANLEDVVLQRGKVTIAANVGAIDILRVGMISSPDDVQLTIEAGANVVTDMMVEAGNVSIDKTIGSLTVTGGTVRTSRGGSAVILDLNVSGSGNVRLDGAQTGADQLGTVIATGGLLDLGITAKEFTLLFIGQGAEVLMSDDIHTPKAGGRKIDMRDIRSVR